MSDTFVHHKIAANPNMFAYRPDIDGLRTVAVTSVVLFHAGIGGVAGGFTGVDIFFVISGYLIGGHIFAELVAGKFSFATFYTRRVRRILPALFAMLTACYLVGALVMTPEEYRELGKEAVAAIYATSNILFYTGGGYFAPAADFKPLLMTWSLGVEEQFYILFPFVMIALLRFRRDQALPILLGIAALSFVGSIILQHRDPTAAFYLLPTRAWELALGAALALRERRPGFVPPAGAATQSFAMVGLAMLAAAIILYRPAYDFPGSFVLLPTLGTVILIATRTSLVNRWMLSPRPMQFVGRVSYSWYLWHWPLFYLNRIAAGEGSGVNPVILVLTSLLLGIVSWRFIEQPLRRRVLSDRVVLVRYFFAAGVVAGAGALLYLADGMPMRLSPQARSFAAEAREAKSSRCLAPYGMAELRNLDTCVPLAPGKPRMLLVGDSHASSIAPGIAARAAAQGMAFGQLTKSSCPALNGYATDPADRRAHKPECLAWQARLFAYIAAQPDVEVVALAGFWSSDLDMISADGSATHLSTALDATVRWLQAHRKQVILIQDVPTLRFDGYARVIGDMIPARRALADALGGYRGDGFVAPSKQVIPDPARPIVAAVAKARSTMLLDPHARLCAPAGCAYRDKAHLYYFDFQHLTASGALVAMR
ncbi:acyltransferase family protein [Sphingobium sp.]|uniref:acyltransferase family protein n=1 Tax=Sphingobium sp. TaxID=1912891 RepID=UPI003BB7FD5A